MPEEKTYNQQNPPNVARGDSAIWIRPDGTAYRKGAGGHSWAEHTVEKKPEKKATGKAPTTVTSTSKSGIRTGEQQTARKRQEGAQSAAEKAEDQDKYAPCTHLLSPGAGPCSGILARSMIIID